jgi:hypothetical protein
MFRSFQGWVSLSDVQSPGGGTLKVCPLIKETTSYIMMRPLLDDLKDSRLVSQVKRTRPTLNSFTKTTCLGCIVIWLVLDRDHNNCLPKSSIHILSSLWSPSLVFNLAIAYSGLPILSTLLKMSATIQLIAAFSTYL